MVIEAMNSGGETAQASFVFTYDLQAVLHLVQPLNYTIGQPDIRIKASCTDDMPGCTVTLDVDGKGETVLGTPVDMVIRPRDGAHRLTFRARDSTGRGDEIARTVFVSSRGGLQVADTFQGDILDIDAGRALTFDTTVKPRVVRLYDRVTHTSQVIWTATGNYYVQRGFLTPGDGVLFLASDSLQHFNPLFEWRGGALSEVASVFDALATGSPVVDGAWAAFYARLSPCCPETALFVRDLTAGTNIQVLNGPNVAFRMDVAPDGRVVFQLPTLPGIFEFNPNPPPGNTVQLTAAPSTDPLTDGIHLVFMRNQNAGRAIVLRTQAGVEEVLAVDPINYWGGSYYQVAGGWTAFMRDDNSVWIREPGGALRQVAIRGYIEALDDSGDLIFANLVPAGELSTRTRYLAKAGGPVRELGTVVGEARFIDGVPVLIAGNQLVEILPQPSRAILAEGATGSFFSTDVAILNPSIDPVPVTVRFFREGQQEISQERTLPARSRTTIHLDDVPGLEGASVSTEVDSKPGVPPVEHTITVPPAARRTFYAGDLPALVNTSFATVIETDLPVVAERAMYFGVAPLWLGGHGSAGVGLPAYDWFHAEGATGPLFDTFILLANPGSYDTPVTMTFVTGNGVTVTRQKTVRAASRLTINVEDEAPDLLGNVNVSTRVHSFHPIVSERAMYWGTAGDGWREAHNSFGVTTSGLKWGLAEGRAGGALDYQTFVLISNTTTNAASLQVTFIREDGTAVEKTYSADAGARLNIHASAIPELADSNFATIVESIKSVPINVESALYWNSGGVVWEAGGNTVATPIP